ncbi:MAG: hypothetical protein JO022_01215 [Acidobacteriaceae bacterium]|nr:hypothetical protein [Acidobacteriaceae bacterium]
MREILVNHARKRSAAKRGAGNKRRVTKPRQIDIETEPHRDFGGGAGWSSSCSASPRYKRPDSHRTEPRFAVLPFQADAAFNPMRNSPKTCATESKAMLDEVISIIPKTTLIKWLNCMRFVELCPSWRRAAGTEARSAAFYSQERPAVSVAAQEDASGAPDQNYAGKVK